MLMDDLYAAGAWMHRSGEDMEGLIPCSTRLQGCRMTRLVYLL